MRFFNGDGTFVSIGHEFVFKVTIQYRYDGTPYYTGFFKPNINGDATKKVIACGYNSSGENMVDAIKNKCMYNGSFMDIEPRTVKQKIFIHSECSIPRDLLRRAYDITRSKDSANYIVIPEPYCYGKTNSVAMFLMKYKGREGIVIVDICLRDDENKYSTFPTTKEDFIDIISKNESTFIDENIETIFISDFNQSFDNKKYIFDRDKHIPVYFLNRCDEYIDILADPTYRSYKHIFQHRINYETPVKICPDVLQIWENMTDEDLLARNILTSDWVEYPITTCVAIANSHIGKYYKISDYNSAFQDVLRTINPYDTIKKIERGILDIEISPKDLDMVQDYIFSKLGMQDDKGFVSHESFHMLKSYEQALIKNRFAVARARITEAKPLCDIFK